MDPERRVIDPVVLADRRARRAELGETQARARLAEVEDELRAVEAELAERRRAADRLAQELDAQGRELLAARQREFAEREARLDAQAEAAAAHQAVEGYEQALTAGVQALAAVRDRLAHAETELRAREGRDERVAVLLGRVADGVAVAASDLEGLRTEHAAEHDARIAAEAEAATLREELGLLRTARTKAERAERAVLSAREEELAALKAAAELLRTTADAQQPEPEAPAPAPAPDLLSGLDAAASRLRAQAPAEPAADPGEAPSEASPDAPPRGLLRRLRARLRGGR